MAPFAPENMPRPGQFISKKGHRYPMAKRSILPGATNQPTNQPTKAWLAPTAIGVEDHVPKLALVVLVHVGGFLRSHRVELLLRLPVISSPAAARRRLRWW